MSEDVRVYNLGEVRSGLRKRKAGEWPTLPDTGEGVAGVPPITKPQEPREDAPTAPTTSVQSASKVSEKAPLRAQGLLAVSASVVMPGTGQLVQKRYVAGAAWALTTALLVFALTGAWAILPRLWAASEALGLPPQASVWCLGILLAAIATLHLANVLSVQWRELSQLPGSAHPAGAAAASALVPGWGQLLNGHSFRGGLFLALAWVVTLAWVLAAPGMQEMLIAYGLHLPRPLATLAEASLRWALPAALWPVAVYDAALWAWMQRR